MNNTERFVNLSPDTWDAAWVLAKSKVSLLTSISDDEIPTWNPCTPLNPRIQPVNDVDVIPVYEIISSFIFNNPYSEGKPLVLGTVIVVSVVDTLPVIVVTPTTTSGTKLSTFKYWSRLLIISLGPPWNSWEIKYCLKNSVALGKSVNTYSGNWFSIIVLTFILLSIWDINYFLSRSPFE